MPRKARYDRIKQKKEIAEIKSNPPRSRAKTKEADEKKTVKALARVYTQDALEILAKIMRKSKYPGLQLQAIEQILNRGWGKPANAMAGPDGDGPVQIDLQEIRRRIIDPVAHDDDEDEDSTDAPKSIEGKKRASIPTIQRRVRELTKKK